MSIFRQNIVRASALGLSLTILAGSASSIAAQQEQPPTPSTPRSVQLPKPTEITLKNGLRVIVIERKNVPLVTAELLIKSGGATDPAGLSGLAGMTAELLTKGTKTRTAPQIASTIEALGGSIASGGGWDAASVSVGVMSVKLPQALEVMADTVQNPAFADEEIERLRAQDIDGLSVALKQPSTVAGMVASRVVFGDGPYGHPVGGTPESIAAIKRADIVNLHATYYRPDNAVLVVGGDVTASAVFRLAEQYFGAWVKPAKRLPAPPKGIGPINNTPRVVVVDMPDAGQAAVFSVQRGISRTSVDYFPGIVTNSVLGGGYSSRLNFEIRIKRGLSYGASSSVSGRRDLGPVSASAQTKNPSAAEVANLMVSELNRLVSEPVDESELTSRKATLIGDFSRDFDTTGGLVDQVGDRALYGLSLGEINSYISSVQAVTSAEVQRFANDHFNPKAANLVIVGNAAEFLEALKKQFPNVEVISASELDLNSASLRKSGTGTAKKAGN